MNTQDEHNEESKQRQWWLLGLFLICALGFYFRVQNIGYGLPLLLNEDEPTYFYKALNFGFGDFDPHYFKKPTFFLYFYFAFYYFLYWCSDFSQWQSFYDAFWQAPQSVAILGRSVTVIFSVTSIGLLAYLGKRLHSVGVGLLAALMLAIDPTHVHYSPIVISDIPVLCMMLLTSIFAIDIFEKGRLKDYLLCGLSIALVISFKYNFFIGIVLVMAHLLRTWQSCDKQSGWSGYLNAVIKNRSFWMGLGLVPLVVVCLSPYLLLNFHEFWQDFNTEKQHMLYRQVDHHASQHFQLFGAFGKIFLKVIPRAIGWPLYVLGLIGWSCIWRFAKHKSQWVVILSFPMVFLLALQQFQIVNAKYLMPLYPFWYLLSSVVLVSIYRRYSQGRFVRSMISIVLLLLLLNVSWGKTSERLALYAHLDTRQVARQWMIRHLKQGQTLLAEYGTFQLKNKRWTARAQMGRLKNHHFLMKKEVLIHEMNTFDWLDADYVVVPFRNHFKEKFYDPAYFDYLDQHYQPVAMVLNGYPEGVITDFSSGEGTYASLYAPYHKQYSKKRAPGPDILILRKKH